CRQTQRFDRTIAARRRSCSRPGARLAGRHGQPLLPRRNPTGSTFAFESSIAHFKSRCRGRGPTGRAAARGNAMPFSLQPDILEITRYGVGWQPRASSPNRRRAQMIDHGSIRSRVSTTPRPDPVDSDRGLPDRAAVVVIGGGIIGSSTALALADKGIDVVL